MEISLNSNNFRQEVLESNIPVLVDFWAAWCGPCRMLAPSVEEISRKYEGRVKVCKLNVDDNMELAQQYRITGIPTLILFKDGKPVNQIVGVVGQDQIEKMLG